MLCYQNRTEEGEPVVVIAQGATTLDGSIDMLSILKEIAVRREFQAIEILDWGPTGHILRWADAEPLLKLLVEQGLLEVVSTGSLASEMHDD